jgi:uncharacterized membrane protein YpjA
MLAFVERLLRGTMDFILRWPVIFWTCFVANLIGAVFGSIFWYGPMLLDSPLWALPFIPDCPLAALLGSIALLGLHWGRQWSFFYTLTAFACIKYGLWTVAYWLNAWTTAGFYGDPIEVMLFVVHIGLFIEGLLFVPHYGLLSFGKRLLVIGVFVLSMVVDYVLGYHPPLGPVDVNFAAGMAILLTTLLGAGLLLLPYQHRARPSVKQTSTMGLAE